MKFLNGIFLALMTASATHAAARDPIIYCGKVASVSIRVNENASTPKKIHERMVTFEGTLGATSRDGNNWMTSIGVVDNEQTNMAVMALVSKATLCVMIKNGIPASQDDGTDRTFTLSP